MAGIDEGINWEAVIREAQTAHRYINSFAWDFSRVVSNFAAEMSVIWASGNAVKFGRFLIDKDNKMMDLQKQYSDMFGNYVNNAMNIYKNTLSVQGPSYNLAYGNGASSTKLGFVNGYKFEEIKNGISGMNKAAVADAIVRFSKNMNDFTEKFKSNITSVHISIFDHAGAQKAAFDLMVGAIVEHLNSAAKEIIDEVQSHVDEEIDNMMLARNKTVNAFTA